MDRLPFLDTNMLTLQHGPLGVSVRNLTPPILPTLGKNLIKNEEPPLRRCSDATRYHHTRFLPENCNKDETK